MKQPVLQIGNGNWAQGIDKILLGYVEGVDVKGFAPRLLQSERGTNVSATRVNSKGLIEKGRQNHINHSNDFVSWTHYDQYDPQYGYEGYDGSSNAWRIEKTSENNNYIMSSNLLTFTGVWTFSLYAKAGSIPGVFLYTGDGGSGDGSAVFDLVKGEVTSSYLPGGGHAKIEDAGNGWWRCSVTSHQDTSGYRFRFKPTIPYGGPLSQFNSMTDRSGYIFAQNAQAEAGVVPTEAIVTGTKFNRFKNSNYISQTNSWTESLSIVRPGQEGYDGTHNAHYLSKNGTYQNVRQSLPVDGEGKQTVSVYAKAGDSESMVIRVDNDGSQKAEARFGLRKGFVESKSGASFDSTLMTDIGNGWWRCELRFNATIDQVRFYPATNADGAGGTTGSLYIQHPQLEEGYGAGEYVDSFSFGGIFQDDPRIDYTNGKAQLLIEADATNKHADSEYRAASSFYNSTGTFGFTSPEGVKNAYKIQANSADTSHFVVNGMVTGLTSADSHTASVFVKAGNNISDVKFGIADQQATTNFAYAYFDITGDGTVGDTHEGGTGTLGRKTIQKINDDGWYRISVTAVVTHDNTKGLKSVLFMSDDGSDPILFQDSTAFMYAYGWQFEQEEFHTSYVPSYGVTGTRSNDNIDTLNYSHFKDLGIGESYTVMFDFDATSNLLDNTILFDLNRTTSPQSAFQARWFGDNSGNPGFKVYDSIGLVYPLGTSVYNSSTKKWVLRIDGATFDLFHNDSGTPTKRTADDDLGTERDLYGLRIRGTRCFHNGIKIFDSALTDDECKDLVK